MGLLRTARGATSAKRLRNVRTSSGLSVLGWCIVIAYSGGCRKAQNRRALGDRIGGLPARAAGVWPRVLTALRQGERRCYGRHAAPSAGTSDSQRVTAATHSPDMG